MSIRRKKQPRKQPLLEALEDQVLYSADVLGGAEVFAFTTNDEQSLHANLLLAGNQNSSSDLQPSQIASRAAANQDFNVAYELIFIDKQTPNYQQLANGLLNQRTDSRLFDVYILDNNHDGVEQISDVLSVYSSLDAVHIISHGTDGIIDIAATRLDLESLENNTQSIAGWADAFDDQGDLLIYGCDLAVSPVGQNLVDTLASMANIDVAASVDITGHAVLGGDWDLEYRTGDIESTVVIEDDLQQDWVGSLAPGLTSVGGETLVNGISTGDQYTTPYGGGNVAMDSSGNYAVVWDDARSGNVDTYLQIYNADGSVRVSEFIVHSANVSDQDRPTVAMADNGTVITTWSDERSGTYETFVRLFDVDGNALTVETQVSTLPGVQASDAVDVAADGSFVVVFQDLLNADIYMQRYDANGVAQGVNTIVNTTTANVQNNPTVALADDGSYVVTWMSAGQDGSGDGIYAQRFSATGVAEGSEFRINQVTTSDQWYATVDSDASGNFVVTWMSNFQDGSGQGIYARLYAASGTALTNEFLVNTTTTGNQGSPNVSMNDSGRFIVTWHDAIGLDGAGFGVFGQLFDSTGNALGTETLINSTTAGNQNDSTVAYSGSDAAVVWSGNGAGDSQGIFAQRFHDGVVETGIFTTATVDGGLSINEDGGNDIYLLADDGSAIVGGQTALSVEIQFASTDTTDDLNLYSYLTGSASKESLFKINSDGSATFYVADSFISSSAIDYGALRDGARHSMGFTWDGSNGHWVIYVDGVEIDSTAIRGGASLVANGEIIESGGTLVFGQEQDSVEGDFDPTQTFSGKLFDVRFFSTVRTASQMASSYSNDLPPNESGLVANWTFGDLSTQGVVVDTVGANNLTLKHTAESGFIASEALLTFRVDENALDGTVVGSVSGIDAEREARIATLLNANPALVYSAVTGKFYEYIDSGKNWSTALSDAQTSTLNGVTGNLVTINSAQENQIVVDLLNANGANQAYLGGSDSTVEGEWQWLEAGVDSDLFWRGAGGGYSESGAYTNWDGANPNDSGGQDFVKIFASTGLWDDTNGSVNQKSVVVYDADDVLDVTDTLSYSFATETIPDAFAIDESTGEISVADGSLLNYETNAIHTLTVRTVDADANVTDKVITVSLRNLSEPDQAPTDLSSGIELNTDGGNDAYLSITSTGSSGDIGDVIGGLSAFTLEMSFSADDMNRQTLFSYAATDPGGNDILLRVDQLSGNGYLTFVINGSANQINPFGIDYDDVLLDGQSHTLAISWDNVNGDWAVYVDGQFIESGTGLAVGETVAGDSSTGHLVLGQEQDTYGGGFQADDNFRGTLYDVRLWDTVRSAADIEQNYQHKIDSSAIPAGLIANWQMSGFNGSNEVVDIVSEGANNNHLSVAHVANPAAVAVNTWVNQAGGVTATGNSLTYVDDAQTTGWNSSINSSNVSALGFTDNYKVSFTLDNTTNFAWAVGLSTTESSESYTDLEHGIFIDSLQSNRVDILRDGVSVDSYTVDYTSGGEFSFVVTGTTLQYQYDGVTFATATIATNTDWYIDTSFYMRSSDAVYSNQDDYSLSNFQIGGIGFKSSTLVGDLHVSENANNGESVGYVVPSVPSLQQDIVDDGLFNHAGASGYVNVANGQTIGGAGGSWTVVAGNVDLEGGWQASPLGGVALGLDGTVPGAILQTIPTEADRQYQIIFALTGNFQGGNVDGSLRVSADGSSQDFHSQKPTGWSTANLMWEHRSFTFTADDASTDLQFASLSESGAYGPVIADVQVIKIPQAVSTILNNDPTLNYDAATGKFYRSIASPAVWITAQTTAMSSTINGISGQLVTIGSAYENQVVRQIAADNYSPAIWLGGSDAEAEGDFRWYEGDQADELFWQGDSSGSAQNGNYTNFATGEPNNWTGEGGQDFAAMNTTTGLWDDRGGPGYAPTSDEVFIIEWDANEVLGNFTFSLIDDASGLFAIDSNSGEVIAVDGYRIDYEVATSHDIEVQVTDAAGNRYSETMTIFVDDGIEAESAPTDLSSGIELNIDDGNDAYLAAADGGAILGGAAEFAVEIAFSSESDNQLVLASYQGGGSRNDLSIVLEVDGTVSLIIDNVPTTLLAGIDYNTLRDGELHSIALSWDNTHGDWQLFVDGQRTDRGTGVATGGTLDGAAGLGSIVFGQEQDTLAGTVGGGFDPAQLFSGTLYDVRIWNKSRTAADIANNYRHKLDVTTIEAERIGLVANWQMGGFDGSNEIVDIVRGNNLSVGHATGIGFSTSIPVADLHINEHASGGSTIGYVLPSAPASGNDIVSDGLFLDEAVSGSFTQFTENNTFGAWTVDAGTAVLFHDSANYDETPLGGQSVEMGVSGGPATISQQLNTETGRQYQVVFALSGDWNSGDELKDIRVAAGSDSIDFSIAASADWSTANRLWEHRSFTFTATDPVTQLSFQSLEDVYSQFGAVIADVRVIEIPQAISTILLNDPSLDYDAATGKFYRHVTSSVTWEQAQSESIASYLNGVAGQLVTIGSAYENSLIQQYALADASYTWIGASDQNFEGDWHWYESDQSADAFWSGDASGNASSGAYQNWLVGQPNNGVASNYAAMRDSGGWSDETGTTLESYVIEWDASELLSNDTFAITNQDGIDAPLFSIDWRTGEVRLADPIPPDSFSDHVVWFDANDGSTITSDAAGVTNVADKTGTGNDAENIGGGPALISAGINGLDALEFDGVDEQLIINNSSTINTSAAQAKTVTLVFNSGVDTASRQTLFEQGGISAGLNLYIDGGNLYAGVWSENNGFDGNWLSTSINQNDTYVVSLAFDANTNQMVLVVNGAVVGMADMPIELQGVTDNTGIGYTRDTSKFHDGDHSGTAHYFEGLMGEFTYNNIGLSSSQIIDMQAHLMHKWIGTPTTLDYETASSHDVEVTVTDATGFSYSEALSITVDNGMEVVQTLPSALTINEDSPLAFISGTATEVSVSDTVNTADSLMRVALSVESGVLDLSQTTGLTFVEGGNLSSSFVIDGTESDINAALDGMIFTPQTDFNGAITLNMNTALASDLASHYTFTDGSADDQSAGDANNGLLSGDAMVAADPERGRILELDGDGDYVQIAGLIGEPENVTLAAWINADSVDSFGAVVISMGLSPALYLDVDGTLIGYYESSGVNNILQSTESLLGVGWTHVAISIDATNRTMSLFIDGREVETSTSIGVIEYDNSPDTYIGRSGRGASGFDFDGLIDDARLYTRALSSDEIAALVAQSKQPIGSIGPDLTQAFSNPEGDSGAGGHLFIHDDSVSITGQGTLSYLLLGPDANSSPINFDFMVLRPDGGGDFEVIHRVPLTDADIVSTDGEGIRALNIGALDVEPGDVVAHWSALNAGSIPYDDGEAGVSGWSVYTDSSDLVIGSTVRESVDSSSVRLYGLSVHFEDALGQSDNLNITVNAVNDAPGFVQPELVLNGTFPTDLTDWTTTGTVDQTGSSMRFGNGNAVGPHSASQTVSTVNGGIYELTFDYRDGRTDFNQSLQVTIDGASNLLTTPQIITDVAGNTYVRYSYTFTADSDSATITFIDTSDTAGVADGTNTVDGHVDNVSIQFVSGTMSEVTFVEDGPAVKLDADVTFFDVDIDRAEDDFAGIDLTLQRNGVADSDDIFLASGNLDQMTEGGSLVLSSTTIGTVVTNSGGVLNVRFNGSATQVHIDEVFQSLLYSNSSDSPPNTVLIDWEMADGNTASEQGVGGELVASASTRITVQHSADLSIVAPATATMDEDNPQVFTGANVISIDDGVATDIPVRVTLSVANGILNLANTTGISIVEGANGSGSMVIDGLESDVNVALNGLTFEPNENYNGSDELNIDVRIGSNLEGLYTFEGGDATDHSSGFAQSGVLVGEATTQIDPERGEVLSLDGDGDSVAITGLYGEPTDVTLAAWVNLSVADTEGAEVITLGDNIHLRLDDTNNGIAFHYRDGTSWNEVASDVFIAGTGWHHVAATFDDLNDIQRIYLDGQVIGTANFSESIVYDQTVDTVIGGHGNGNASLDFNGLIDDVQVYSRALSAEEIATLSSDGSSASASVALTVNPINDAPGGTVVIDNIAPNEKDLLTASHSLSDVDGLGAISYQWQRDGVDVSGATGNTYSTTQADSGASVRVIASYTDAQGTMESVPSASVYIAPVDDAAVISGDISYTGDEGDAISGTMVATDVEGLTDGTVFSISVAAANGTASIDPASGAWAFTPTDNNWFGNDSFTVTVTDDEGGTTNQVVSIALANVDDPSAIGGDTSYSGDEGDPVAGVMSATDIEGLTDGTVYMITATATNGTAVIDPASGSWTYSPADINWYGSDSFTVTVTDDLGGTTDQIVNISLVNVDDPATVGGDTSYSGDEGDTVTGQLTVSDVDSSVVGTVFSVETAALNGTAVIDSVSGNWSFTPSDIDWFGTDEFTVRVEHVGGSFTLQVVDIVLANVNDIAVIGGNDSGTVTEDIGLSGNMLTVNGALTVVDADVGEAGFQPVSLIGSYGNLTMDGSGNWLYTLDNSQIQIQQLDSGESLTDTLTISTIDGTSHTLNIQITGSEDSPVITGVVEGVVSSDTDPTYSNTITISDIDLADNPIGFLDQSDILGDAGYGVFSLSNGNWTYTLDGEHPSVQSLDSGNVLIDSYNFLASDGSSQMVTVTIFGPGNEPALGPAVPEIVEPTDGTENPYKPIVERPETPLPISVVDVPAGPVNEKTLNPEEVQQTFVDVQPILIYGENELEEAEAKGEAIRQSRYLAPPSIQNLLALELIMNTVPGSELNQQTLEEESDRASRSNFNRATQDMRDQIRDAASLERRSEWTADLVLRTTGVTLSAGSLAWLLQSGSLFATALSTIPTWQGFDPLPVLSQKRKSRRFWSKKRRSVSTIDRGEAAVGQILDSIDKPVDSGYRNGQEGSQ